MEIQDIENHYHRQLRRTNTEKSENNASKRSSLRYWKKQSSRATRKYGKRLVSYELGLPSYISDVSGNYY
jgi:hypothetical protein